LGSNHVYYSRYTPAGGWSGEQELAGSSFSNSNPRVAMDDAGNAFAVWIQRVSSLYAVEAAHFSPLGGWTSASPISASSSSISELDLAVDGDGRALAAWISGNTVWANVYVSGAWAGDVTVSDGAAAPTRVCVAMGSASTGIVVWQQGAAVWSNAFGSAGWGGAETRMSSGSASISYSNPSVAMDRSNNVILGAQLKRVTVIIGGGFTAYREVVAA
jgi:hypothetical protein